MMRTQAWVQDLPALRGARQGAVEGLMPVPSLLQAPPECLQPRLPSAAPTRRELTAHPTCTAVHT